MLFYSFFGSASVDTRVEEEEKESPKKDETKKEK